MTLARISLLLLLVLVPLLGGQLTVTSLALLTVVVAGGWLGWAGASRHPGWNPWPVWLPLGALLLVTGAATLTSVYTAASVLALWRLVVLCAALGLLLGVPCERQHYVIGLQAFALATLVGAGYAAWQWLVWVWYTGEWTWRMVGTWGNANAYAGWLLVSLPLLACWTRMASPRQRWLPGVACGLGVVELVLTQSRGGVLAALLVVCLILPLWWRQQGRLTARQVGLGALGVGVMLGLILLSPLGRRVLDPQVRAQQVHSQQFRIYTWQGTVHLIKAYPLLGSGPNTFPSVFGRYQRAGFVRHAHQIYLQAAAETGVIGLLIHLWVWGGLLVVGGRALRAAPLPSDGLSSTPFAFALLAATGGMLLHGLLDADWSLWGVQFALLGQAAFVWRLQGERARAFPIGLMRGVALSLAALALLLWRGARAEGLVKDAQTQAATAPASAAALFTQAVQLAPTHTTYLRLAAGYVPFTQGAAFLHRAQRLEPTNATNWLFWGDLVARYRAMPAAARPAEVPEWATAYAAYQAALAKQPGSLPALFGMAQAAWGMGEGAQARATLDALLATRGSLADRYYPVEVPESWFVQSWYAKGCLAWLMQEPVAAAQAFARAQAEAERFMTAFQAEAQGWALYSGNDPRPLVQALAERSQAHRQALAAGDKAPAELVPFP
jgi:O-antigen ligase